MSVVDRTNRLIRDLAREGKKPARIAADLRDLYGMVGINAAQVRLVLENSEDDQDPTPPLAAADTLAFAHENMNAIRMLIADAMEVARLAAEAAGKSPLEIRIDMGRARLAMQDEINAAIKAAGDAGRLYVLLGGKIKSLPKAMEVRVRVVGREDAPVTTPTPEPS